jgi:hypothetical protein
MKTLKKILYSMFTVFLAIIFTSSGFAQESIESAVEAKTPEMKMHSTFMIDESDFSCFREISCLRSDKTIRSKGLKFNSDTHSDAEYYVLEGYSPNEIVEATYNDRGALVEGRLVHVNILMPAKINRYIFASVYSDWKIVKTERVIHDFDVSTKEYHVTMQKRDETVVLSFDKNGDRVRPMAGV